MTQGEKKMKKMMTMFMAVAMISSLVACGNTETKEPQTSTTIDAQTEATKNMENAESDKPETIIIQSMNGEQEMADIEVPYDPQRIAVLDMPTLDIIDSLGMGDRIVGSASVTIEYLTDYNPDDSNGAIMNLGTVKTADLEKVAACEPDVIFIGGRLSSIYNELSAIAPVVYLPVDYNKGIVASTADNAKTIGSMFGKETDVDTLMEGYQTRIDALNNVLNGKDILLCMYNANAMSLMDTESALNILVSELGGNNLGETVGEANKATHGEEASWETIVNLNPEYMFVLDRSTAIGSSDEGVLGAKEVVENDLVKEMDVYKNGHIVYFIEHANVWYTSTGGVQALDTMLSDLEGALLVK